MYIKYILLDCSYITYNTDQAVMNASGVSTIPEIMTEVLSIAQDVQEVNIVDELQQLQSHWESNVIKLGVIGATNSGKSTTINALLGGRYLPASAGSTTARVVCIRCDPTASECTLSITDSHQEPLAVGEEQIHIELKRLNSLQRAAGDDALCQSLLHMCVSRPVNIKAHRECCLELFDTPGMSEATEGAIYKDAKKALDQMDGIVIVLSQDTAVLRETTELMQNLQKCFPELLDPKLPKRAIVVMNKYDQLLEENRDVVTEKKEQISTHLHLFPEDILYYSARMGLESRIYKADPPSVTKSQFRKLLGYVEENKEYSEQVEKCSDFSLENVKELAEIAELVSSIKIVEESIKCLLPDLKNRKVVAVLTKLLTQLESHHLLKQRAMDLKCKLMQVGSC